MRNLEVIRLIGCTDRICAFLRERAGTISSALRNLSDLRVILILGFYPDERGISSDIFKQEIKHASRGGHGRW